MYASVIIPVWNGEAVIADCLQAIYDQTSPALLEVICVDNASRDSSASLISERFPQVLLLEQPVNLGFAGGVNQGIEAAKGDFFILLNQDVLVQDNWLPPLVEAFAGNPDYGILGATIFNPDGTVNHTGAHLRHPDARGIHETIDPDDAAAPRAVDYVTGALFALRRSVWDTVGTFDEDFYPAYYEEVDYCYRARKHGFAVVHVPGVHAVHHFTSKEWQKDPLKHAANQHFARYRFVAKHFADDQLLAFFETEAKTISAHTYRDQVLGALLGARAVLEALPAIQEARRADLVGETDPVRLRTLKVRFAELFNLAYATAGRFFGHQDAFVGGAERSGYEQVKQPESPLQASRNRLATLREEENRILARLYFRHPEDTTTESRWQRWWRLLALRSLSILILRDYRLLARLNTLHTAQFAQLQRHVELLEEEAELRLRLLNLLTASSFYEPR